MLPVWCGYVRNSQEKLILDVNGQTQSICVSKSEASSCRSIPNLSAKVVSQVQSIFANSAAVITALGSDNTPMATLSIPANTVSDVSFVLSPVADSIYQVGSFASLFSSGKLRSPLISIIPSTIVDTRSGGISLTLPVDVPADQCVKATSNMKVKDCNARTKQCAFVTPCILGICNIGVCCW
jgi:hypothetical protein